jgi:hypothetical protein
MQFLEISLCYCTLSLCAVELIVNCHSLDSKTGLAAVRQCRRWEQCGRFTPALLPCLLQSLTADIKRVSQNSLSTP